MQDDRNPWGSKRSNRPESRSEHPHRGRDPEPLWQDASEQERGSYRQAAGLFRAPQPRLNQFERSHYGYPHDHEPQRQGGSHAARGDETIRSRSADPGQSSYGGFSNEDPRRQRQELRDYTHSGGRKTLPKGYVRSDERIREELCERLSYSGFDVSDVEVTVSSGEVTLDGAVGDRASKHAIEDYAAERIGVKDVHNRIRVHRTGSWPDR